MQRFATSVACLLLIALLGGCGVAAQTCLNERGEAVDWFVILKVPKDDHSPIPSIAEGYAYLYGDAVSRGSTFWTNSSQSLADPSSSVGRTLTQIYDGASDSSNGYVFYNDELPNGPTSDSYGHSKGQLMWSDAGQGFWLIHSVPKYAESPSNGQSTYEYPETGVDYGQSMLCITMDIKNIDQAFAQLQLTNPQVYGQQWVSSLASSMPNADAFLNQGVVNKESASNIVSLLTLGGLSVLHFAKTEKWGQSIFGDLIGPYYQSGVLTETWQRPYEAPLEPPTVQYAAYSVLTLSAPTYADWDGVSWKEGDDHSKWAVLTSGQPIVCIGDINKQVSQYKRSGGMACFSDAAVHQAFTGLITSTDIDSKAKAARVALE